MKRSRAGWSRWSSSGGGGGAGAGLVEGRGEGGPGGWRRVDARRRGGNIGVTSGKDGIFLIDDQFEPPSCPKIRAAVKTLGDGPIRFVVNTHFHGDHTGSNARLYESGAVILAQENVRKRLGMERISSTTKERTPPKPARGLAGGDPTPTG
jgi:glyoxylase-like metal-dependent hydrolase (beta-lactamase superfamily II)